MSQSPNAVAIKSSISRHKSPVYSSILDMEVQDQLSTMRERKDQDMAMAAATAVVMATTAMAVTATAVTAMAEEIMVKVEVVMVKVEVAMAEIMVKEEEVAMVEIMVKEVVAMEDKGITVTAAMDLATKLEVADTETADLTQIM